MSVRVIHQGAFSRCWNLRQVVLNAGLEMLGAREYRDDASQWSGVFEESVVERVTLPSTLRRIECRAFKACRNLKDVAFPEGLEEIGEGCFWSSGLEKLVLPDSVREIGARAFSECRQLKSVWLSEKLEKLGAKATGEELWEGVFSRSAIESVRIPSGLRRLEAGTFY